MNLVIRPARPEDVPALLSLSLRTGDAGGDASPLHRQPDLIGLIYSAPYAVLDPGLCLVAADADGVLGYCAGATDTRAFEQRLEAEWWPALRARFADLSDLSDADRERLAHIRGPTPTPKALVERYPAHAHLNVDPRGQGQGLGRALFSRWLEALKAKGAQGLHIGTHPDNARAVAFWSAMGFEAAQAAIGYRDPGTIWMVRGV